MTTINFYASWTPYSFTGNSNGLLVERLSDVTAIPYPVPTGMLQIPTDDTYIKVDPVVQETTTVATIRALPDYVYIVNPIVNLHSKMHNQFYRDLMDTLKDEAQNLVDHSSYLKTLFDIDYFDGDTTNFSQKIDNLVYQFNYQGPVFFSTSVNFEVGDARDITKEHDFLRNIVKHIWLSRAWAGTANGYALTFKLVNRLGSAHPRAVYLQGSSSLDISTGKLYRLLDTDLFQLAIPGGSYSYIDQYSQTIVEPTYFPNSPHIPATTSLNNVTYASLYWDTGHNWDEIPTIKWDLRITPPNYGKGLILEYSLDRILHNTNVIGTTESLQQQIFLDAIEAQLPTIQKASESVSVGSQITMVTSKDGKFNTLSNLVYTHPNIKAKFQVFKYLPDKVTPSWNSVDQVNYIKIGSGGYSVPNVDNNVFVDRTQNPNDPGKIVPIDVQSPVYESYVGEAERSTLGSGYGLVNTTIHPRTFSKVEGFASILINEKNVIKEDIHPTNINLPHTLISRGTLNYGVFITKKRSWDLTITSVTGATYGTINIMDKVVSLSTDDVSTISALVSAISSQDYPGWKVSVNLNLISFVASDPNSDEIVIAVSLGTATNISFTYLPIIEDGITRRSIFQKLLLSESVDQETSNIVSYSKVQKMMHDGKYYDLINSKTLFGYSIDSSYSLPTDGYMPVATDQAVIMNPLYSMDKHPTLWSGLVLSYNFDSTSELPTSVYRRWNISGTCLTGATFTINGVTYQALGTTANQLSAQIAAIVQSGFSFQDLTGAFLVSKTSNDPVDYLNPTATAPLGMTFTKTIDNIYYANNMWTSIDSWTGYNANVTNDSINKTLAATITSITGGSPFISRVTPTLINDANFIFKVHANNSTVMDFGVTVNGVPTTLLSGIPISNSDQIIRVVLPSSGTLDNPTFTFTSVIVNTVITFPWIYCGSSEYISGAVRDISGNNNACTSFTNILTYGAVNKKAVSNNTSSGILVAPSTQLNSLTTMSISCIFDSSSDTTGTIMSKYGLGSGWRLRYISGGTLEFTVEKATTPGIWTIPCPAQDNNFIVVTYDNSTTPVFRLNKTSPVVTVSSIPSGSSVPDVSLSLGIGLDSNLSNGHIGSYSEIRVYNRALSYDEVIQLESDYLNRLIPITDYLGNIQYYYFDAARGMICMKLQYDPIGLLQSSSESLIPYSSYYATLEQSYSLNISNGVIKITEMGLFDVNHNMLAYATFPPVIYDASKNHISFNLLISTTT
jgi:hypothetical protein